MFSLLLHYGWYDLPLLYWYVLLIIPSYFFTTFIWFPIHFFLPTYHFFRSIPTPIHLFDSAHFFTSFTWFADGMAISSPFSFHHRHSHWLLLSSHAHEILLCVVHYTPWYEFDHWVFEPSFLSFLCLFTLAYVTSHVLRPPWGHEIRRYLWQSSLR